MSIVLPRRVFVMTVPGDKGEVIVHKDPRGDFMTAWEDMDSATEAVVHVQHQLGITPEVHAIDPCRVSFKYVRFYPAGFRDCVELEIDKVTAKKHGICSTECIEEPE